MATKKRKKSTAKAAAPSGSAANPLDSQPAPAKRGNPSKYTRALADEVCERLAGGETLTDICRDEHMPERQTVIRWKWEDVDGFALRYVRAREIQRELWADQMIDIGNDGRNDWMERHTRDEVRYVPDKEVVDRSKLRCDNLKWLLARLDRNTYGDKVEQTHKADAGFIAVLQEMGKLNRR